MFMAYQGWGQLISGLLSLRFIDQDKPFIMVWLGWLISLLFFSVLHLFLPLTYNLSIFFFGFGLIFFVIAKRNQLKNLGQVKFHYDQYVFAILLLLIASYIASRAMLTPTAYDSGLYHFSSIRWLNECSIVPGLGNLHGRLAFNQTFFSYVAYLNFYPLFGRGHNVANSFLLLLFIGQLLYLIVCGFRSYRLQNLLSSPYYFSTLLFLPVSIYFMKYHSISSPNPDFASSIIQIILFLFFVKTIEKLQVNTVDYASIGFLIIMSVSAVTIKLSNVFYVVIIVLTILWLFIYRKEALKPYRLMIIKTCLLVLLILLVWTFRGIVSSGYPAYPSTFGEVDTEWTMSRESVRDEAEWVYSFARQPGHPKEEVLANWNWFSSWLRRVLLNRNGFFNIIYPILTTSLLIIAAITFRRIHRTDQTITSNKISFFFILPVVLSLLCWFFTAPSIRFANALFFILPVSASLILFFAPGRVYNLKKQAFLFLSVFIIINAHIGYLLASNLFDSDNFSLAGFQPIKKVELTLRETDTGLLLMIPTQGEKTWDSPLPATPYFNRNLQLRGSQLCEGFIVVE
jgi:hypothetical protein